MVMNTHPSILLAQLNFTVGDIAGNVARIRDVHAKAAASGAELVVFPELCVIGYPPEDLIFTPKLCRDAMAAVQELAELTIGDAPAIVLGGIWEGWRDEIGIKNAGSVEFRTRPTVFNCVFLLADGEIAETQAKHHLPNEGVFDERRVFTPGMLPGVIEWRGRKLGILVCEDMWQEEAPAHLVAEKPDILICINASPFELGKQQRREALAANIARQAECPFYYLNMVGGQDELVFDGGSFVMDGEGVVVERLPFFEEVVFDCPCSGLLASAIGDAPLAEGSHERSVRAQSLIPESSSLLYRAMVTGLRDYVEKSGFPGVVIGLSGGIDSALTACVAVDALGAERVQCVMLPSPYTSQISLDDAAELAVNLGVRYDILPITPGMEATDAMLAGLEGVPSPLAQENIQSRLRGLLLMAISNSTGSLLITTGNKSEMAVGYATLYGDMCGAFSVLKDVYKTEVFALARWRNEGAYRSGRVERGATGKNLIPERTITRPPSAELRENQKDEDSLPPYEVLDKILFLMVEERMSVEEISAKGFDRAVVQKIARLLYQSEYKRRQAPPGVKLTRLAFGRDRRFPLTNRFIL